MPRADIEGRMSLNTSAVTRNLQKAKRSVTGFVSSSMRSFGALAGVAGLGALSRGAINLGSQISDLATQLRIGTTELQVLQYAAQEAGVPSQTLERALRNVQLRTQDALNGNKRYAEALQRLGLNVQKFAKLSTDKKFEAIGIAQSKAKDSAQAYRDVAIILGERAGPQLQEVLQKLANEGFKSVEDEAKKAGQVMEDQTIEKLDKASDEISKFKKMLTILSGEILAKFVPGIKILGQSLGIVGEYFGATLFAGASFFKFLGKAVLNIIEPAIKSFQGLSKAIAATTLALQRNFSGAKSAMSEALELQKQAFAELKNIPADISSNFSDMGAEMRSNIKLLEGELDQRATSIKESWNNAFSEIEETSKKAGTAIQQNIAPEVLAAVTAPSTDADSTASTVSKKTKRTPQKATWRASNVVGNIGRWGSRFGPAPTFEERERAAGLYLRGNDPMAGRRATKVGGERAASPSNDGQKQSAEYLKNISRVIEKLDQGLSA